MHDVPETAIVADGLARSFGNRRALREVTLTVKSGTTCALVGAPGSGKTTTLAILAGRLRPDAGRARVFGLDVSRAAPAVRSLTALGDATLLDADLSPLAAVDAFARVRGMSPRTARARAAELGEALAFADVSAPVAGCTPGVRKLLDVATALLSRPQLIFLDEPTTGLEPDARRRVGEVLRQTRDQGTTVLVATKDPVEARRADSVVFLDEGRSSAQITGTDPAFGELYCRHVTGTLVLP